MSGLHTNDASSTSPTARNRQQLAASIRAVLAEVRSWEADDDEMSDADLVAHYRDVVSLPGAGALDAADLNTDTPNVQHRTAVLSATPDELHAALALL